MRRALTKKIISHLSTMMKKDTAKYKEEFYKEYAFFLKEGICQDYESQQSLSKLLYFETSKGMNGELVSLDEYVSRCPPEQKDIYYLYAPSRELALQSPYMEAFSKNKREVLFIYTPIDDFVMTNLKAFEGRNLVNVDSSDIDFGDSKDSDKDKDSETDSDQSTSSTGEYSLTPTQATEFCAWFQSTMSSKVSTCRTTNRLSSSPAVITGNESAAYRRIMRMVETSEGGVESGAMPLPKQTVEINPNHEIIAGLYHLKNSDPVLAQVLAEQIFDNCLTAAGLLDDGRSMLPRLNDLLLCIVKSGVDKREKSTENAEGTSDTSDSIPRAELDSTPQDTDENAAK
ncbi:hypothetical protein HJC23_009898 [Cyclotella cryptica]|uniref:Heat shock protein 90 n=1 Tax=Cyclotella cryptica TaxID=29204 RepID=A0ABD3QCB4_9STRA